jgi:signal transduction histidine kinase
LTAAVLVLSLAATAGTAYGFHREVDHDRGRRFDAAAERARGAIDARLEVHTQNLAQLRNWVLVHPALTRADFEEFASLGFDQALYPGVQALTVARRVLRADVDGFEASVRTELAAGGATATFDVHPDGGGADAYVVTYIEPLAGNEAAFGFDLGSDATRLRAIETARDSGGLAGSGPVRLVQESGDQTGFVLFAALYDTQTLPTTVEQRRDHFTGVVGAVFRVGDMFEGVLGPNPETDAEVYDVGPISDPPEPRYDSTTRLLDTDAEVTMPPSGEAVGLHRDLDLNMGDRRWRIVLTPAEGFAEGSDSLPIAVAILGGLGSVLLASVVQAAARGRDRAERRATEMTADLRDAQAALQVAFDQEREVARHLREADELKTAFLNTVSHELQTPLTAISGFTELLLTQPLPEEQREDYLRRVRRNAQVLSTLIAEVLAFARLEREDLDLQPVPLDLVAETALVVDQLTPLLDRHTVVVDAPDAVAARIDREAYVRILTNLLSNATRYSPAASTITISLRSQGGRAVLAISDEGPGIPPEEVERVFERFYRGATALDARVPGTGIGLSVVRELAERSAGTVRVTRSTSGGASFEVDVPAAGDA